MNDTAEPMLPTQSEGAGQFARLDLSDLPSPCFVVDEAKLRENLEILAQIGKRSGAKVLAALKAFSMWRTAPLIREYLDGVCTSGLWETRLAKSEYCRDRLEGEITTYSAGYKSSEILEISRHSDHMIFNSPEALTRFGEQARGEGCSLGLRVNPLHSEGLVAKYDPCAPGSRLGTPITRLAEVFADPHLSALLSGIHMHTLCEQGLPPLLRTWDAVEEILLPFKERLKWINLGGGHHITRSDYDREGLISFLRSLNSRFDCQIYLEPGEAIALDAGILVGEVLDVTYTPELDPMGAYQVVVDLSATCHMPDVIEAPYRPALLGEVTEAEREGGADYCWARLGGPSCLAGDQIGCYALPRPPKIGDRLAFLDQAHYSMVKTTTFNGVSLPSIALWNSETGDLQVVKEFEWETFKSRLS